MEQAKGKVQHAVGKAKNQMRDAADKADERERERREREKGAA